MAANWYDFPMDLGFSEMLFIVVLALLIFGPRRLPEIGRQLGKALNEFKRAKNEFTAQIEDEVRRLDIDTSEATHSGPVLVENNSILPPTAAPRDTVTIGENAEAAGSQEPSPRAAAAADGTNA